MRSTRLYWALLHKSDDVQASPFPRTDLSYGLCDRYAESRVAVQYGDAYLGFRDLPVEVPRHERLAHQFQAMHLGFDAASAVVSAPALPQSAAKISLRIDRIVAGNRSGACRFPRLCIFARWDHCMGVSGSNGIVAFARVVSPICGDTADVLAERDLVQEIGQHGSITDVATGDFDRPYL